MVTFRVSGHRQPTASGTRRTRGTPGPPRAECHGCRASGVATTKHFTSPSAPASPASAAPFCGASSSAASFGADLPSRYGGFMRVAESCNSAVATLVLRVVRSILSTATPNALSITLAAFHESSTCHERFDVGEELDIQGRGLGRGY